MLVFFSDDDKIEVPLFLSNKSNGNYIVKTFVAESSYVSPFVRWLRVRFVEASSLDLLLGEERYTILFSADSESVMNGFDRRKSTVRFDDSDILFWFSKINHYSVTVPFVWSTDRTRTIKPWVFSYPICFWTSFKLIISCLSSPLQISTTFKLTK